MELRSLKRGIVNGEISQRQLKTGHGTHIARSRGDVLGPTRPRKLSDVDCWQPHCVKRKIVTAREDRTRPAFSP
ncbi:MAG: hypothetical protein QOE09_694 [Ilumatobacteraceae bacterium]|jgi:hypothetical protein